MNFILIIIAVVVLLSAGLFFFQSKILFHPVVLDKDYKFKFDLPFEEKFIKYSENKMIDAVLFKPSNPSVRILYIHGNAGSLMEWG
ncbi:MAG: alpha/beta hydrolase, partial [Pseudobdellovibrio sp.]